MSELCVALELPGFHNRPPRPRIFPDRNNPLFRQSDEDLFKNYRFPKVEILQIIELCSPELDRLTNRNFAIPTHLQVMVALRFYAKGMFQNDLAELFGISQSCVSRIIDSVSSVLSSKARDFIRFPDTPEKIMQTKQDFYDLNGFPNIIGAVDGSLIEIFTPNGIQEPLYVGRKKGHTLNVQVITDGKMRFTDVVAKWPGATHDSFIWRNCGLRSQFAQAPPNGFLLGDSGYPSEPWLLTPFLEPVGRGQVKYNSCHKKTRRIVECAIGLWKSVFRRIDETGGRMMYSPKRACKMIIAMAILHNIRRELRLPEDDTFEAELQPPPNYPPISEDNLTQAGVRARNEIIQNVFNNF